MSNHTNSGKAGTIGFCLMFVAAGIYSLFHDELHIVSPRHGFALSEPYKIAASIGFIGLGVGAMVAILLREASEKNDLIGLIRMFAFVVAIGGASVALLSFLTHYLIVWFG